MPLIEKKKSVSTVMRGTARALQGLDHPKIDRTLRVANMGTESALTSFIVSFRLARPRHPVNSIKEDPTGPSFTRARSPK